MAKLLSASLSLFCLYLLQGGSVSFPEKKICGKEAGQYFCQKFKKSGAEVQAERTMPSLSFAPELQAVPVLVSAPPAFPAKTYRIRTGLSPPFHLS